MLRFTRARLEMVTGGAITHAAKTLNKMLDVTQRGGQPVPRDDLKAFLRDSVMPVMRGTELDRRGNSTELRQYLGQLTRDAVFAASVLKARPDAAYVQCLVTCIKEDHQRMRFIPKMPSTQATKIIEHLCNVAVRDEAVFPVLLSRVNFSNLRELARVVFALAEANLHELNMLVVVPLYCGETWQVEINDKPVPASSSPSSSVELDNGIVHSCNVYEAVRVLRAISKSCRACVEDRRRDHTHSLAEIPRDSLNTFRNQLLKFIFTNSIVLRGAHWANVARALLFIPTEYAELYHIQRVFPDVEREVRAALHGNSSRGTCPITCETVAAAALAHVFDYAEHRRVIPAKNNSTLSPEFPFDLGYADLVKLLPLLERNLTGGTSTRGDGASFYAEQQRQRVDVALRCVASKVKHLHIQDLVKVLQSLRTLSPSSDATATLTAVAEEISCRFAVQPPSDVLREATFAVIVRLAAALSALRVTRCDGFARFVSTGVAYFPHTITIETALAFVNALANLTGGRRTTSSTCHNALDTMLARLMVRYAAELQQAPLLDVHPHAVVKILRSCVLLDYIPAKAVLESLLGSDAVPLSLSNGVVQDDGGSLVFGLSRTMTHFLKQARARCPERVAELWNRGVCRTTMPLAIATTEHFVERLHATQHGEFTSYVPVSWRTTLETLTAFADPLLDFNTKAEMAQRLVDGYPATQSLLQQAALATAEQTANVVHACSSVEDVRGRYGSVAFAANSCIHFLSALLMWEYLLYQGVAQLTNHSKRRPDGKSDEGLTEERQQQLVRLKETSYAAFLQTPLVPGTNVDTPMDVVRRIFAYPVAPSNSASTTTVLLTKRDALEITTNLPFALSLVMCPGPVNEFFTEHCMSLMVSDDDALE